MHAPASPIIPGAMTYLSGRYDVDALATGLENTGSARCPCDSWILPITSVGLRPSYWKLRLSTLLCAPSQTGLNDTLQEIKEAARAVRSFADYLDRHPEALISGKPGG